MISQQIIQEKSQEEAAGEVQEIENIEN